MATQNSSMVKSSCNVDDGRLSIQSPEPIHAHPRRRPLSWSLHRASKDENFFLYTGEVQLLCLAESSVRITAQEALFNQMSRADAKLSVAHWGCKRTDNCCVETKEERKALVAISQGVCMPKPAILVGSAICDH